MNSVLMVMPVPEKIQKEYLQGLQQAFPNLEINLVANVDDADPFLAKANILITHGHYLRDRADHVFANMPLLEWVQDIGVGVDNIVDRPTLAAGVTVTNIHGVHGAPMTESAISLLLALSRQLPRTFKNQINHHWERWPAHLLNGKTIGILGVGSIAESVGPACKALGMTVIGITSGIRPLSGFDRMVDRNQLLSITPELDYLLTLIPYSEQTRHIVDANVLSAMKPTAYLVNLARGGIVDESALLEALQQKKIAGAALDVFTTEPLPATHPFWDLENIIITCHQSVVHDDVAKVNLPVICENMRRFVDQGTKALLNIVRPPLQV
jgi:phosphoglycerate dehydrogenase-like enzyme